MASQALEKRFRFLQRHIAEKAIPVLLQNLDAVEDFSLGLGPKARKSCHAVLMTCIFQLPQRGDAQLFPKEADLLGAEPRDADDLENAGGRLRAKIAVVREPPGAR